MRRLLACCGAVLLSGCLGLAGDLAGDAPDAGGSSVGADDAGPVELDDAGLVEFVDAGAPGPDAGPAVDAGPTLAPDAGADLVPVFVAVGKQGRRAISCDDGRTWKNDVSFDDAWPVAERYRCFSGNFTLPDGGTQGTDCDHNAASSTSLAYAGQAFVQTTGWGAPGTFYRSTDGVTWTPVFSGANVTDVMVGPRRLIAATRSSRRSDDFGATWTSGPDIDVSSGNNTIYNVRGGVFGGGVYLVTAQDGTNLDFAFSADDGATWRRPTMQGGGRVDLCGAGHPAFGGGVFVTTTWSQALNGTVICRSADGAATWTSTTLANVNIESRPVWTGAEFLAWSSGQVHRSADGLTWTTTATQTRRGGALSAGPNPGPVARGESGTFVAVKGGWDVWYEKQRFYRSTDGVTWDELADGAYRQGHPVTAMAAGLVSRSAVCP